MNRVIKFRAYQPHNSLHRKPGMYEVEDIVWYPFKSDDGYTGEVFFGDGTASSEYLEDVHLMQYTGLKDKNGVEVYEGDIIVGEYRRYQVTYEGAAFRLRSSDGSTPDQLPILENSERVEVMGNVHENPDLLKEDKTV